MTTALLDGYTIAALYVETGGCYFGVPGVDPWDETRDARLYDGPHPVVAHPPCQRWGRYWHGSPRKPHQYKMGDDKGCFRAALSAVRRWGGVLEHPAYSHAWKAFGLEKPPREGGWVKADDYGGYTCHIEQGHYGHFSRKPTWLYGFGCRFPADLSWGVGPQQLDPAVVARYGYVKARRSGAIGAIGKDRKRIRNATPFPFRDLLLSIATSATMRAAA